MLAVVLVDEEKYQEKLFCITSRNTAEWKGLPRAFYSFIVLLSN